MLIFLLSKPLIQQTISRVGEVRALHIKWLEDARETRDGVYRFNGTKMTFAFVRMETSKLPEERAKEFAKQLQNLPRIYSSDDWGEDVETVIGTIKAE